MGPDGGIFDRWSIGCAGHAAPGSQRQVDSLFEVLGQEEQEAERNQEYEKTGLEVLPAVEEAIPGPNLLGEGRDQERDDGEDQQAETDPRTGAGELIELGPVCVRVDQMPSHCARTAWSMVQGRTVLVS